MNARGLTRKCWRAMIDRCHNPKASRFDGYGGRGITVHRPWRESFDAFLRDVGLAPPGLTLDRIDNARGYEPGNVRWATTVEQARNRSDNTRVTMNGETRCLAEWAELYGLRSHVLYSRLRLGWPADRAITTPVRASYLSEAERMELTRLHSAGVSQRALAARYGITQSGVSRLVNFRRRERNV